MKVRPIVDIKKQTEMKRELGKDEQMWGVLWIIGVSTGLRVSDLLRLRLCDTFGGVDCDSIVIRERKTGKERRCKLSRRARTALDEYVVTYDVSPDEALFKVSRQQVYTRMKRAGKRIGLDQIGTHTMRMTYAVNVYYLTHDLNHVQRTLGHEYRSTTVSYLERLFEESIPWAKPYFAPDIHATSA